MKLSITTKWFLWLSVILAAFSILQVLTLMGLEVRDLQMGKESMAEETAEIITLLTISLGIFGVMALGLIYISRRMIHPIRQIAEAAHHISKGELSERITGTFAEDEIGLLVNTLNRAFDRYHDALNRLDRFAGNAAHQLRTPLTTIRSMGEIGLQKEREPEAYRECIRNMLDVAEELTLVVQKLLVLARLNRARIRQGFQPLNLADEINQVIEVFLPAILEKSIQFDHQLETHSTLMGDAGLIRQAMSNLLDNATRFTPEGGQIRLVLRREGRDLYAECYDSGPPFPETLQRQIGQEEQSMTPHGDCLPTGRMGLALVSEIMRIHEGRLAFLPAADGLKCIRLSWPVTEPAP